MAKMFIYIGIALVVMGVLIHFLGGKMSWFGNLFGDVKVEKENFRFYFPITSMIIISIFLSIILNFFNRFFK